MKKAIAITLVTFMAFSFTASAQQKIGHINSLDILQAMPEFKQMNTDIDKQKQTYQKALETMYTEYEALQKKIQEGSKTPGTPDAILESQIQELQDKQKRIQDFESKVNDDLQKLQQEKLKPINDKYLKAVKEVATGNGYSYILDVVSGAVAYYPEGTDDVTSLVMKKLGITAAPAGTGTTGTGTTPKGK
jgi:outer membrane protein